MGTAELAERKRAVLTTIIRIYVDEVAPVSSQSVCEQLGARVSSATIRNIMAELEEEGFITHPHTSAGRVPTDKGYRYFVDALMEQAPLSPPEMQMVQQLFLRDYHAVGELLEQASRMLAGMTQQLAVGLAPALRHEALKRFEAVPLGSGKLLGVLRTTDGFVHSHVINIGDELTSEELSSLLRFINAELAGVELAQIEELLTRRLLAQQDAFFYVLKRAMQLFQSSLSENAAEERIYYDGVGHLLIQPEFRADVDRMQAVVQILESKAPLMQLMEHGLAQPGLTITIGHEHASAEFYEYSMVSASYGLGGHVLGRIGVVGPKRMSYPKVVALVDYVAQQMSEYLTHAFKE